MKFSASLLIIIFAFLIGCNASEPNVALDKASNAGTKLATAWAHVKHNKLLVKNGDLVTRAGMDMISSSLRNFNKQDKSFSHSGIALIEGGEVYVYHTLTGEENKTDKMMREPFDSFCKPERKRGMGIFRYALSPYELSRFDSTLRHYYKTEMRFDKQFDLKQDSTMYCAEIIYKALKQSTNNRVTIPTTVVTNFKIKDPGYKGKVLKKFEYVAIDNLYLNTFCKEVVRTEFE